MKTREPQTHLYYDKHATEFSNVALGILTRAIGHNLKITYYNSKKSIFKLIYTFRKTLLKNINFYDYYSLHQNQIKRTELVIFDCCNFEKLPKQEIENILENKHCEIIIILNKIKQFHSIKNNFDLVSQYIYKTNKNGKENIINITGNGKGKSTYAFGFAIQKLIQNQNIKIIYFDKGGDFYGEKYFFDKLKKTSNQFNYHSFGLSRINKDNFRFKNLPQDKKEAEKGLNEIQKTHKETLIIADELNTTINSKLLDEKELIATLDELENQILISGRYATKELLKLAQTQIEVKEIKHYCKQGKGVKKGIDY